MDGVISDTIIKSELENTRYDIDIKDTNLESYLKFKWQSLFIIKNMRLYLHLYHKFYNYDYYITAVRLYHDILFHYIHGLLK